MKPLGWYILYRWLYKLLHDIFDYRITGVGITGKDQEENGRKCLSFCGIHVNIVRRMYEVFCGEVPQPDRED